MRSEGKREAHTCALPDGGYVCAATGRSILPGAAAAAVSSCTSALRKVASASAHAHERLFHSLHRRGSGELGSDLTALLSSKDDVFEQACRAVLRERPWGRSWLPEGLARLLRSAIAARQFREVESGWTEDVFRSLSDPLQLLAREDLLRPFGMHRAAPRDRWRDGGGPLPSPDEWWCNTDVALAELLQSSVEAHAAGSGELWQSINALSGSFACPTPLLHWCERHDWHDCITQEYVDALAEWLARTNPLGAGVVEVGCGRGRLSWHLAERLRGRASVVGTDSDCFDDPSVAGAVPGVVRKSYRDSLRDLRPRTVVCAWMPAGEDWTGDFRACGSVQQYVLLGPLSTSATEEAWAGAAGWRRLRLRDVESAAVCRLDCGLDPGNSRAVAFVREAEAAALCLPEDGDSSDSEADSSTEELPACTEDQLSPEL